MSDTSLLRLNGIHSTSRRETDHFWPPYSHNHHHEQVNTNSTPSIKKNKKKKQKQWNLNIAVKEPVNWIKFKNASDKIPKYMMDFHSDSAPHLLTLKELFILLLSQQCSAKLGSNNYNLHKANSLLCPQPICENESPFTRPWLYHNSP